MGFTIGDTIITSSGIPVSNTFISTGASNVVFMPVGGTSANAFYICGAYSIYKDYQSFQNGLAPLDGSNFGITANVSTLNQAGFMDIMYKIIASQEFPNVANISFSIY